MQHTAPELLKLVGLVQGDAFGKDLLEFVAVPRSALYRFVSFTDRNQ